MPNASSTVKHIVIVVGDPSADRHAAALVRTLRTQNGPVRVSALGGAYLHKEADRFVYPLVQLGGFGFIEALSKIPALWRVRRDLRRLMETDRPDLVILVDYYGFNIHVARLAKSLGIPVVYYISPQVWASRPGRVRELARTINRMLVIFPFEEALYRDAGVAVSYVGHPLLETVPAPEAPPDRLRIGLLPGSRRSTVARHLPIMVETAKRLHERHPAAEFVLFRPEELPAALYDAEVGPAPWIRVVHDPGYEERRRLTLALSVSGTAALENMLLGIPMVIMYRLSLATYWIARWLIRVPFVGIPNVLANRAIVPECLQAEATPEQLSAVVDSLIGRPDRLALQRTELLKLRGLLETGASRRAADEIARVLATSAPPRAKASA